MRMKTLSATALALALAACQPSEGKPAGQSPASPEPQAAGAKGMPSPDRHADAATKKEEINAARTGEFPFYSKKFDDCSALTNGVTIEMMDCLGEEMDYQDARLNAAYRLLKSTLNKDDWVRLRSAQRSWLASKDHICRTGRHGGTGKMLELQSCMLRWLAIRATDLEDHLLEGDAAQSAPEEIRKFVPARRRLLAYKKFDLTGDGMDDAVIIIRHPVFEQYANYKDNPCDLIVLHGEPTGFEQAAKSSKAVDCTYKNYARYSAKSSDSLNDYIEMYLHKIIYFNERDMGGGSTYAFKFSEERKEWHLSSIETVYSESGDEEQGIRVFKIIASYPKDFDWIELEDFQPDDEKLSDALQKNVVETE